LLHEWTDILVAFDDPDSGIPPETLFGGVKQMFAYVSAKSQEKRVRPGNDVWSLVVNAEVDGEQLSKGQLERFFQLLMVAGNETTRNLIAHGVTLLSKYPDQRRRLHSDMTLLPAAIEVSGPIERARSNFLNGLHHVPVRFTPAQARSTAAAARAPAGVVARLPPAGAAAAPAAALAASHHGTRMLLLFGSNFGTAEDIARKIAGDARGYGFVANAAPMD